MFLEKKGEGEGNIHVFTKIPQEQGRENNFLIHFSISHSKGQLQDTTFLLSLSLHSFPIHLSVFIHNYFSYNKLLFLHPRTGALCDREWTIWAALVLTALTYFWQQAAGRSWSSQQYRREGRNLERGREMERRGNGKKKNESERAR